MENKTDKKSADKPIVVPPAPISPPADPPIDFTKLSAAELMAYAAKRMEAERAAAAERIAPMRADESRLISRLADLDRDRADIIKQLADVRDRIRAIDPDAGKSAGQRKTVARINGRDPRLPPAGTLISMQYRGTTYTATTTESAAVLMDGITYNSLSAAARAVGLKHGVDTQFDGYRAFKLNG